MDFQHSDCSEGFHEYITTVCNLHGLCVQEELETENEFINLGTQF